MVDTKPSDQNMEGFAKELFEAKRRFTFKEMSSEDFVTSGNENEPEILSKFITCLFQSLYDRLFFA